MGIPVGSELLVSIDGTWSDQQILFTQSYVITQNDSVNTIVSDLNRIGSFFAFGGAGSLINAYLACMGANYSTEFIRTQVIRQDRSVYVDTPIVLPGTFGGIAQTGNLQFPITLHTDNGGRNQVSVKKIGPAPVGSYQAGEPDPVFLAGPLSVLGTELKSPQQTVGTVTIMLPIVAHPDFDGDLITGVRLPNRVGTMRRRTLRVGV